MLPAIFGYVYGLLPDFIPGPFDDTLVAAAGAIISFALAVTRYADMPRSILFPLFGAALYTVIGSIIPGPVDELLVDVIMIGTVVVEINKHQLLAKAGGLLPDSKAAQGEEIS